MEFQEWLNWWSIAGTSLVTGAARFAWRRARSPGVPGLALRCWRRLLTLKDLAVENQRLQARLAASLEVNKALLGDLERLSSTVQSRGWDAPASPPPPSERPTNDSTRSWRPTAASRHDGRPASRPSSEGSEETDPYAL